MTYKTKGVCASHIEFEVDGETGVSVGQFASFVIVIIFTVILLNYYSKNNKSNSAHCDCSSCKSKCSQGSK